MDSGSGVPEGASLGAEGGQQAGVARSGGSRVQGPSTLPAVNAEYLQPQYWNRRFETEESFEWFKVRRPCGSKPQALHPKPYQNKRIKMRRILSFTGCGAACGSSPNP